MLLQRSRRIKKLTRGAQNVTLALTLLAAFTVTAQDTESALQRGEEFLRAGSYAAASEIFLQAQA